MATRSAIRSMLVASALAACAVWVAPQAGAAEIYRWVDQDGEIHFSDKRPVQDAPVTVIEIESAPATPYDAKDDPYSILNQAARIHERWLELEETRQTRAEERRQAVVYRDTLPPDHAYDSYREYSSFYPYYSYLPSNGSDYRPGQGRQQVHAMHTLDLLGPRPASINSGVHQDRVSRSQLLPLVPPPPAPQPLRR